MAGLGLKIKFDLAADAEAEAKAEAPPPPPTTPHELVQRVMDWHEESAKLEREIYVMESRISEEKLQWGDQARPPPPPPSARARVHPFAVVALLATYPAPLCHSEEELMNIACV